MESAIDAKNDEILKARRKPMQVMTEYLMENEGILKVVSGGKGFFGPQLVVDPKAVRRKIFNQKRPSVFQYMARIHHKFGIRHYVLVGLLAVYSTLGGLIFLNLEAENEVRNLELTRHQLIRMVEKLSQEVFEIANVTVDPVAREDVILLIQEYYREMLKIEGKYAGSIYHKFEKINMRLTWYYSSSVFFAMTLFTTIGYGTIAAETVAGKIFTVIYSVVGIPLMLVVLSDVGRVLLRYFTKFYNFCRKKIWIVCYNFHKHILKKEYGKIYENTEFPLAMSIPVVVGYLFFCGVVVSFFDYEDGLTPGLSVGDAMYFSFISMSTIGLGDVMPNNIEYSPFLALMFLFGLALISVVNSTVYEKMEKKFLYSVEKLENWLENVHYHRHGREGYGTFKALGPNMQLLALVLPIFDENEEDKIEASLESDNTELGKKVFPRLRTKTNSLIEDHIEAFRPVLGIFGGVNVSENKRRANTVDCSVTKPSDSEVISARSTTPSGTEISRIENLLRSANRKIGNFSGIRRIQSLPGTGIRKPPTALGTEIRRIRSLPGTRTKTVPSPSEVKVTIAEGPPEDGIRRAQSDRLLTKPKIIQPKKFRLRTISELV